MLSEVENARQVEGEGPRRWFRDKDLDLIVWYDDKSRIDGFQLCYNTQTNERALTWRRSGSYSHDKVDGGDVAGGMSRTPVLVTDGFFDKRAIVNRFLSKSERLPEDIRDLVVDRILAYGE